MSDDPGRPQFRTVASRTVFDGKLLQLRVDTLEAPDGQRYDRELVHHPGAVAVIPITDDGEVVLVRQYRSAVDEHLLEIPAGLLDMAGEPPEGAARRELREEVGLVADRLEPLAEFVNSPGFCDERVRLFVATGLREVAHERQGAEEEHMEVVRLPLADAVALALTGGITDAKTLVAVSLAAVRPR